MSVGEALALTSTGREDMEEKTNPSKRRRFDRCFSFMEIKIEAGSLKELDPNKLKMDIRRWAKAVVAYARQVSGKLGSSRGRPDSQTPGIQSE